MGRDRDPTSAPQIQASTKQGLPLLSTGSIYRDQAAGGTRGLWALPSSEGTFRGSAASGSLSEGSWCLLPGERTGWAPGGCRDLPQESSAVLHFAHPGWSTLPHSPAADRGLGPSLNGQESGCLASRRNWVNIAKKTQPSHLPSIPSCKSLGQHLPLLSATDGR